MTEKIGLSSPWIEYVRKLRALFEDDPEVRIEYDEDEVEVSLYVDNSIKAEAIEELLPYTVSFGNVDLEITVIPANASPCRINLIRTAFDGNPILSYIEDVEDLYSNPMHFIVFNKEVVQYYNDNLCDPHGVRSTLYQEIAKEVLGESEGIYFCTDTALV